MTLALPAAFFADLRTGELLGPTLTPGEVQGCEAILAACEGWPISWTAYALATAYLETAHSMQPIKEFGGEAYFRRMYDIEGSRPTKARELGNLHPGDGARFCGRSFVMITGAANYRKFGALLNLPLLDQPELVMRPDVAAKILRHGMADGLFTGRSLSDYLPDEGPATVAEFTDARRIINAQDRAKDIAGYAADFQDALTAGAWT